MHVAIECFKTLVLLPISPVKQCHQSRARAPSLALFLNVLFASPFLLPFHLSFQHHTGCKRIVSARDIMSAVQVPAYTSQYFGYDGPWQAVTVEVGGFDNGSTASSQWATVQVMPGSTFSSWFVSSTYCQSSDIAGQCGTGGLWNPGSSETQSGAFVAFEPNVDAPAGISAVGQVYIEDLSIVNTAGTYTAPNVTLAEITNGNITYANGATSNIDIGVLSLGAPEPMQSFSESYTNASDLPITGWLMPAYLYNTSVTSSYSFSLQIGSAAFDYPISLWFGGYDKSRAIGPYTTWDTSSALQLLDITLGVETGASPFDFPSMSGLLLDDTSTAAPIPVNPNALSPGLHLPRQTCDNLVKYLPVQLDSATGYYMWDTSSPSYAKIVKSPAYLGMVFPPATGETSNVTIKVPFSLLNLTLEPTISGLGEAAPYFPCNPISDPSSGDYTLGRAFLQAAFWACNWNKNIQWLAQAPGPGPSKDGLGTTTAINIQNSDTSIDVFEGSSYFSDSWSNYWTPLSDDGNISSGNTTASNTDLGSSSGLSAGADIGIGVGVGVGIFLLLVIAALIYWRHRRRRSHEPVPNAEVHEFNDRDNHYTDYEGNNNTTTPDPVGYSHYAPVKEIGAAKYAPSPSPAPQELSGHPQAAELESKDTRTLRQHT